MSKNLAFDTVVGGGHRSAAATRHMDARCVWLRRKCAWLHGGESMRFFALLALALPFAAAETRYTATNLPDITPGEDFWRYDYRLIDLSFFADQGFSIGFDPSIFLSLRTPPPPVPAQWDVLLVQPSAAIPSDGLYDALALVDNPPVDGLFSVEFVFGGPGSPGSQPYSLNQFDSSGTLLGVFGSGETIPELASVPEPGTEVLTIAGMCVFGALLAYWRR